MIIRQMNVSDLEEVARIEKVSNPEPWTYADFEDSLAKEDGTILMFTAVDEVSNQIFGYLVLYTASGESEIVTIAVAPDFRRRGIAESLIEEVLDISQKSSLYIEEINLEVRFSNEPARKLYEKCGFEIVGQRPNFYHNPKEDAILMKRIVNA